ncbi:transglycosylase SLT domain-containing protein [Candidatus Parcubacteria bacterium]|nr:transglycosylase SLT domain-containing protein [Candidatus Parcubacteria bacterium]
MPTFTDLHILAGLVALSFLIGTVSKYGTNLYAAMIYETLDTLWDVRYNRLSFTPHRFTAFFCIGLVSLFTLPDITYSQVTANCPNSCAISLPVIASLESSNRPRVIGDGGRALGLFQLHSGVVSDFNSAHKTSYQHQDALNREIAQKIAHWYLETRIPQILKSKKLPVSTENVLTCWNAGCGRVKNPPLLTQEYIKKYKKLTRRSL